MNEQLPATVPTTTDVIDLIGARGNLRGWTSLPLTTPAERARYAAALTVDPPELEKLIGKVLIVEHVSIDLRTKSDGEILTHIVLIESNGDMCDGSGRCLANSMRSLFVAMGPPPWQPPLPLRVGAATGTTPDGVKWSGATVSLEANTYQTLLTKSKK